MSLDYNTKAIADRPELSDENGFWIPEFQSVCFATMNVGIPEITEKNVEEFYRRYVLACYAMNYEPFFNLEKLRLFIGLKTNASTKTVSAFNKDILANLQDRALRTIRMEKGSKW
jgi:hypothetical protein